MTWWRTARDSSGMTVVERLEFQKDCWESGSIAWQRERGKRIRSILRRLKICSHCRGKRIIPTVRVIKKGDLTDYT